MEFHKVRRQQFLGESTYTEALSFYAHLEQELLKNVLENESYPASIARLSHTIAFNKFCRLVLRYTGGGSIEAMRQELEEVIAAYEQHGNTLWAATGDRNETVFDLHGIDDYCQLMQLIGLCFLLHRRDLLSRIAALQDGESGANGGADNLYEEFMAHGLGAETRYESDWISATKPYQALSDALFTSTNDEALKHLHRFLKHWYKDLAGTGWHDSHKPDEAGNQGGYYGYWSFEAGAAVLLLGIEDDSSLHQYLYYPTDLVAWSREHAHLSEPGSGGSGIANAERLHCEAGQPCPHEGWWFTPAKADSRRFFKQGEVMPAFSTDYGSTIWQWDERQGQ